MPPGNPHTSVRSRQVAAELRMLSEQAGLSGAEVAKRMGMSPSKISRIETGNSGLQIEDIAALLGLYQVPAATRDDLLDLVRRSEERSWWTRQPGLPQLWRSLIDFEAKATRVQNYEALFVPGLLQTAEYARAIIQGVAPTVSEAELDNLVAARMARQALLARASAPQFLAVVDEGALRRPIGEPGMPTLDLSDARWHKSSDKANCVEVAVTAGSVAVRNSKHPTGGVLAVSPHTWTTFTTALWDESFR
ncbi:MAG: Scr1 family TA system antitoxin-like transcriptional regulator [Pseudonocardiaceae bacterium]